MFHPGLFNKLMLPRNNTAEELVCREWWETLHQVLEPKEKTNKKKLNVFLWSLANYGEQQT